MAEIANKLQFLSRGVGGVQEFKKHENLSAPGAKKFSNTRPDRVRVIAFSKCCTHAVLPARSKLPAKTQGMADVRRIRRRSSRFDAFLPIPSSKLAAGGEVGPLQLLLPFVLTPDTRTSRTITTISELSH